MKRIAIALAAITLSSIGLSGCASWCPNVCEPQRNVETTTDASAGVSGGYIWSQDMQEQKESLEQATQGTTASVSQTDDNQLKLNLPSDTSFDPGRYAIKSGLRPILDHLALTLIRYPDTTVSIIGHTDSTGSDAVNNPLSVNRAKATRDYLMARGVIDDRISVEGQGSSEPIADNSTPSGRATNRRVEIYVGEVAP